MSKSKKNKALRRQYTPPSPEDLLGELQDCQQRQFIAAAKAAVCGAAMLENAIMVRGDSAALAGTVLAQMREWVTAPKATRNLAVDDRLAVAELNLRAITNATVALRSDLATFRALLRQLDDTYRHFAPREGFRILRAVAKSMLDPSTRTAEHQELWTNVVVRTWKTINPVAGEIIRMRDIDEEYFHFDGARNSWVLQPNATFMMAK